MLPGDKKSQPMSDSEDDKVGKYDGEKGKFEKWSKRMARWCRSRHGQKLGDMFWKGTLPALEGADAIDGTAFNEHANMVWKSINQRSSKEARDLWNMSSGFWGRDWHKDFRQWEYDKIYDKAEATCGGDALLELEALGRDNPAKIQSHLRKQFGGSGEDLKAREAYYEAGMPEQGKAPFYKGCDMEKRCRVLQAERTQLLLLCPEEKRPAYEMGKETTLVKIVLKHLRGTDYHETAKGVINQIKMLKQVRAMQPVDDGEGGLRLPDQEAELTLDDWDFRNFSDDWLPRWSTLKSALVAEFKERGFMGGSQKGNETLPSMLNPQFGQRNNLCYACGRPGCRIGSPDCPAPPNTIHHSAPERVKQNNARRLQRLAEGGGGSSGGNNVKGKKPKQICRFFANNGTCRFGANCKFSHETGNKRKAEAFTSAQVQKVANLAVKAMTKKIKKAKQQHQKKRRQKVGCDPKSLEPKVSFNEKSLGGDDSDDDAWLAKILVTRTIPRDQGSTADLTFLFDSLSLHSLTTAVMDTGSGATLSTEAGDFIYLDDSVNACKSLTVMGPSVGAPTCGGRGPVGYPFEAGGRQMILIDPKGALAKISSTNPELTPRFKTLSTQKLASLGVETRSGTYGMNQSISCAKTGESFPLLTQNNILVLDTNASAKDVLVDSPEVRQMVLDIELGNRSPIVDIDEFMGRSDSTYWPKGAGDHLLKKTLMLMTTPSSFNTTSLVMNEAKLGADERSRLWTRKLNCDNAMFPKMAELPEYGYFPKLKQLNEDNKVGNAAKFREKAHKRQDPSVKMDGPCWWRTYCDAYGGQNSLGGESLEGAKGGYLFMCPSTGSEHLSLYASHEQYPIALHQFLVRVEAEHYRVHVLYVDGHSVLISEEAERVAALFKVMIKPASAGTPQEMAFVESRVRLLKRHSTAQMLGAPHMKPNTWALSDKYAVYVRQFLPQATRNFHCSFYLRTGKIVEWSILFIHVWGAPVHYAPMDGPIHKRASLMKEGWFVGMQYPSALIMRKEDNKVIICSTKKIVVYESAYTIALDQMVETGAIAEEVRNAAVESLPAQPDTEGSSSTGEQGFAAAMNERDMPPANLRVNQNVKSMREHDLTIFPGETSGATTLDESAVRGNAPVEGEEGLYLGDCNKANVQRARDAIDKAIEETRNTVESKSVSERIIERLKGGRDMIEGAGVEPDVLKKGKKKSGVTKDNIVKGKRKPSKTPAENFLKKVSTEGGGLRKSTKSAKKGGIKKGDWVSAPSTIFDGDEPGSYSNGHPERCHGIVVKKDKGGVVRVRWKEDNETTYVMASDLTVELDKTASMRIIVMLVEGEAIAFDHLDKHKWPKDFFHLLVKSDWRKWVEAVKKEIDGWDDNDTISIINIEDVPHNAKVVPLGELYSIKRDGRYKYRQYLMGNLLRDGKDFGETWSTTVSGPGVCVFFSLATTCNKPVWGWDAVCGYLQSNEQYNVYAFFPSHQEYSSMSYEELAEFRKQLLKLGEEGLKHFAKERKRESRTNPRKVLKMNRSVYGSPGAGHEFEMLVHSVQTKTAGMTQTQPEPSMYVKIRVDEKDDVIGYVVCACWTDDVRCFGTDEDVKVYLKAVQSRLKITIEKPPTLEFVSIETHQDHERMITELKMPKYWEKAAVAFASHFPNGFKTRQTPLSIQGEKILLTKATDEEIAEAKHLPYAEMVGVMSYPAANCKGEMRHVISLLGSHRTGWSRKHFDLCLEAFEYGWCTKDIGIMFSKGLDPHGENVLYGYADSGHSLPRSQGCRIVMCNGGYVSFKSKKHSITASSTCEDELIELFNASTDILGLRNLMAELGVYQMDPTRTYQDNKSAITIANNRGSLGPTSRAIDRDVLCVRNRIEDHQIETKYVATDLMVADIGTKALPPKVFVRHRDVANGYALVKSAHPDYPLPDCVFSMGEVEDGGGLQAIASLLMKAPFLTAEELHGEE